MPSLVKVAKDREELDEHWDTYMVFVARRIHCSTPEVGCPLEKGRLVSASMDKLVQGGWSRDSLLSWLFPVQAHAEEEGAGWAPYPSFELGE